jgi:hypothetical protein
VPSTSTYPNNWTFNLLGSTWTNQNISITNIGNASAPVTMRLVLMWRNDSSTSTQPPAAIDDVTLFQVNQVTFTSATETGDSFNLGC